MKLLIRTYEGIIFEGDVDEVILPAVGGNIAVFKGHVRLVTILNSGELLAISSSQRKAIRITSGSASIQSDRVTVFA